MPPAPTPTTQSQVGRQIDVPVNTEADKSGFSFGAKGKVKPKKPSISKPSSSFVHRIVAHENLARFLTYRPAETSYIFCNVGKSFIWADYFCQTKEALSCIHMKEAFVTCHDVNLLTRDNMDTVMGFSTGDVIWYSPISGKYSRLNKQGAINKSAATCIKWMPGSENMFMVGFEDGCILIFDKEREDQPFPLTPNEDGSFQVCKPAKSAKGNPMSVWQVSRRPITAISFSPDCQHVAITSMDGRLRVVDYVIEKLWDTYSAFFGGLTCVCWSPDGKFILTGGQDDLVTIWAFRGKIVARCQGHSSWVTSVAFDAYNSTDRSYRFGSVSEDTKICMWDFSVSSLHRPKMHGTLRRSRAEVEKQGVSIVHPLLPKNEVAILEPFMMQSIHADPLCSITFREDAVITTDRQGLIKIWTRPKREALSTS
ncbi:hypothetical protein HDU76_002796 [Blyttiomyces sp. JEL0837]|nr:hypothetical protein HDU76_002796 [Blyttiomyces sp. JEL0837]